MEQIILRLIQSMTHEGPLGLAVLVCFIAMGFCLLMGWLYHQHKVITLQTHMEECRYDKQQLMTLVKNNTLSIERNTTALKSNTDTVNKCIQLIQRMIVRFKQS